MKFLNKTNCEPIGLYNNLKIMRQSEFSFKNTDENQFKFWLSDIIGLIQNFYLSIFQNQKV